MNEKAIALPFSVDPYGKISVTSDQSKIWADRVRSVVGTTLKERVMRPDFGGTIAYSVFESAEKAQEAISADVAEVFSVQLPLLTLNGVSSTFDEYTSTLTTDITYSIPNNKVETTTVGIVTIVGNNPPIEETL